MVELDTVHTEKAGRVISSTGMEEKLLAMEVKNENLEIDVAFSAPGYRACGTWLCNDNLLRT